jgi:hypothetical protein
LTNSIDGQILGWELTAGFPKIDPIKLKDVDWEGKSCIYAWDTLGAWSNNQ